MSCTTWNNFKYRAPIDCLIDTPIRVFDIRAANISVLREKEIINPELYNQLRVAAKIEREVYVGKLQGSDPAISKALAQGIIEAKQKFFVENGLDDSEILEVDNDAVYVIGNIPIRLQQVSPFVYFKKAEEYTSFYRVKKIEYFYYANLQSRMEYLNPKGLGSRGIQLHSPFMLDFLKELFMTAQFNGIETALQLLSTFYGNYCSKGLDVGFYRNLNTDSMYSVGNFDKYASYFINTNVDPRMKKVLDISYNEKILREFNRLLSNKFYNR